MSPAAHGGRRTITIVNGFGDSNLGGAAITLAACDLARQIDPEARLVFVATSRHNDLSYNQRIQPDLEVLPAPLAESLTGSLATVVAVLKSLLFLVRPGISGSDPAMVALREADVVIAKGGFVYRERQGLGGLLAGWFTMWPFLFAKRSGSASVAYSASIGPFETAPSRALSRIVLRGTDLICPRDADSDRLLDEALHLSVPTQRMSDCVFGLAGDRRLVPEPGPKPAERVLTIVPRTVPASAWPAYVRACRLAIERAQPDQVELVLQSRGDAASGERLCQELDLDPSCIHAVEPDEAVRRYQQSQLVVTGRMHGAIFSLLAGCPAVMIEIATEVGKTGPVLADLGLEWALVDAGDTDDDVRATVDRLLDPALPSEIVAQVDRVAAAVRRSRDQAADLIKRQLAG